MDPEQEPAPVGGPPPGLHRVAHARLFGGPAPAPDRVFYHNVWFRGHNNTQAEGLLTRIRRVDCYLAVCSSRRVPRAIQFRSLRATENGPPPAWWSAPPAGATGGC